MVRLYILCSFIIYGVILAYRFFGEVVEVKLSKEKFSKFASKFLEPAVGLSPSLIDDPKIVLKAFGTRERDLAFAFP